MFKCHLGQGEARHIQNIELRKWDVGCDLKLSLKMPWQSRQFSIYQRMTMGPIYLIFGELWLVQCAVIALSDFKPCLDIKCLDQSLSLVQVSPWTRWSKTCPKYWVAQGRFWLWPKTQSQNAMILSQCSKCQMSITSLPYLISWKLWLQNAIIVLSDIKAARKELLSRINQIFYCRYFGFHMNITTCYKLNIIYKSY